MQGLDIVEVAGGVGDEGHVEGLLEVADHTGAFASERVPLHGEPLPKQI